MTSGRVSVAISTTGEEHRLPFLVQSVEHWNRALPPDGSLFVTVDGSEEETARVGRAVFDVTESVYRVGQPHLAEMYKGTAMGQAELAAHPRLGVAANKNTGLELLMGNTDAEHLFLSDDDTWPLYGTSLDKHITFEHPHSMLAWGRHRLTGVRGGFATWSWPRGVMLYATRSVIDRVGGMDERFGPGGHEHVEWSQRIHNAGLTPTPFITPLSYAEFGVAGHATRASALWHAEDMRRPGEKLGDHRLRRKRLTSVRRSDGDWERIEALMSARAGSADFVDYHAGANGRASATLCQTPSRGAGGEE